MPRLAKKLGQAELEILHIVQEHQPVTVGEVARRVAAATGKARTTVATVVHRLLKKGFVTRRKVQGKFQYSARLGKAEVLHSLVQSFVENTLGGSFSPFVAYLADRSELTPSEIKRLRKLVRQLEPAARKRA